MQVPMFSFFSIPTSSLSFLQPQHFMQLYLFLDYGCDRGFDFQGSKGMINPGGA